MLGLNYQSCEYNKRLSVVNLKSGLDAIPKDAIDYIKEKFEIKSNWYFKNINGNKKAPYGAFFCFFF